jgi:hypothetical protein
LATIFKAPLSRGLFFEPSPVGVLENHPSGFGVGKLVRVSAGNRIKPPPSGGKLR